MRGERIVCGKLLRHLLRGFVGEASCLVKRGQLVQFDIGLQLQLLPLLAEQCPLGVALRADRYVFANCHRQGTGDQAGDAGGEYRPALSGGRRDANHDAGRRDDPIVSKLLRPRS